MVAWNHAENTALFGSPLKSAFGWAKLQRRIVESLESIFKHLIDAGGLSYGRKLTT
jgi:hypothetical protein